mgnify:CR=1 FL=1
MKKKIIPYGRQFIDSRDILEVQKSLKENFITTGNYVSKFEYEIKKKFNSKYAITCSSASAGLHLAFLSINLKKNDVVIMPSINFISAYRMAHLIGAKIYLTDVDPKTGQMTPDTLKKCIKQNNLKRIKAIVTMYLGGYIKNNLEFFKIKKKYECTLIEDACHAIGGKYSVNKKKFHVGSCKHADLSVFSFHPVKTITTGEGGVITTNNKRYAEKMKLLRSHGIERERKYWEYDIKKLGYNYRLSDINCALGLSQIRKLNSFFLKRKNIFRFYKKKFQSLGNIISHLDTSNIDNCYHFYILSIDFKKIRSSKDQFIKFLNNKGILPQYHYVPIFKFSFYKKKNTEMYKGAMDYYRNTISLPIYYSLTHKQQIYVINNIMKFLKKNEI